MAPRGNFLGSANRLKTTPIPVQRTNRTLPQRILTSLPAGKMVPVAAFPLLREDSVTAAAFRIGFEMQETVEVLMNAVNVRVQAHLVSKMCFERFGGSLDAINKSYEGLPLVDGGAVIPWFETALASTFGAAPVLQHMGKHYRQDAMINTEYVEAYNCIWNHRATQRSPDIDHRSRLDSTLAPAFWLHQTFAHIVPDFDQAIIDGEVALNMTNARASVKGIGFGNIVPPAQVNKVVRESGATTGTTFPQSYKVQGGTVVAGQSEVFIRSVLTGGSDFPDISMQLADDGITVSLSNIEMARKSQAFANLRRQYHGHSDEYIIDLLMDGISIPDQMWQQPILLGDQHTVFGMSKRYASDAANLTESVVNGMTFVEMRFNCPRVPVGGVIMITAEIMPEQLFERQKDPYLHASSVADVPQFLPDTLDPEKVVIVKNEEIDIDHDTPNNVFGYAPLNHQWLRSMPQVGGKFYRPTVDAAFDEDRQRIWAVETQNPVLSRDFYLCTTMHYKPFVVTDTDVDPFECLLRGSISIRGNTVFGGLLVEATNDYAEIEEEQRTDRLDKGTGAAAAKDEKPPSNENAKRTPAAAAAERQAAKETK